MNYSKWIMASLLVLFITNGALAQQPNPTPAPSYRYRAIFTVAGAAGGFATGVFTGFAAFDDAPHAEGKIWATAIIGSAGGGVGGYFLGRLLDKRRNLATAQPRRQVQLAPVLSTDTKGVRLSISF